jgi:PAS domain S-box-containing protein
MAARPNAPEPSDASLLSAVLALAADGIVATDAGGTVRLFNPGAERLFGYRAEEVLGRSVSLLMSDPARAEHEGDLRRCLEGAGGQVNGPGCEVSGRRKDGSLVPIHLSVGEVNAGGELSLVAIVHDLSGRRQAEDRLRRERDRVQRYLDIAGAMIVAIDADQTVSLVNPRACQVLGYPADEVLGRNWFDHFVPEAIRERTRGVFARLVTGEVDAPEHFENPVLTRGGEQRTIAWHNAVLRDDDGRVVGTLSSGEDVTELKRAMGEVQRMRLYLKNIIDSMPSVLVGVDAQGLVTEWNQGAQQWTGVRAADALGRSFGDLLPPLRSQLDNIREAVRRREPVRTDRLASESGGEVTYSEVVVYPLHADAAAGAVVRVDDITTRVRMEQMMVQTEKMMSVGGIAAGMAHEINNPLSAVLQARQNILRRLSPDLPANLEAARALGVSLDSINGYLERRGILGFLDGIGEGGTRAARIVADMLAFSRRSDSHFAPADVHEMLETVLRLVGADYDLSKGYDFRRIQVERDYGPDVGPVHCDHTEIEQVFLNVVKNATQSIAHGGKPPPHRITLRTRSEGESVRVEIEDNGPGMDDRTRMRIFEPFFTTKAAGLGTGLGLSVSYFIVTEHHGGSISVSSTPGEGTCFTIRLPRLGRGPS